MRARKVGECKHSVVGEDSVRGGGGSGGEYDEDVDEDGLMELLFRCMCGSRHSCSCWSAL